MMNFKAVLGLLLCASGLKANCSLDLLALSQKLYPGKTLSPLSICKVWPAMPDKTLVALLHGSEDESGSATYDLALLILNHQAQPLNQSYIKQAFESDAIRLTALEFDTARYQLTSTQLAFGLRSTYQSSSRANPYSATHLSLYVEQPEGLKAVLSNFQTALDSGEWDGECAGNFDSLRRTLAITSRQNQGWFNIRVNSRHSSEQAVVTADNGCESSRPQVLERRDSLRYQHDHYVIPSSLHRP